MDLETVEKITDRASVNCQHKESESDRNRLAPEDLKPWLFTDLAV